MNPTDTAACDVTSSGRLIAPESHATAWEMCGLDTIRTKFAHGDPENAGVIVAQFWTRPSDENRALMVAAPELLAALRESLSLMESLLANLDGMRIIDDALRIHGTRITEREFDAMLGNAKAVIGKAEGRDQ